MVLEFSTIQCKHILSNRLKMVIGAVKSLFSTKISCICHISRIPKSIIKLLKDSLESTNKVFLLIVNWLYRAYIIQLQIKDVNESYSPILFEFSTYF